MALSEGPSLTSNVPRPLTRFIGREDEIESILGLLQREDVRIVTLTGPGGIGKTRLSIEIAHQMQVRTDRSVEYVTLAPVNRVSDALPRIAEQLGLWNTREEELLPRLTRLLEDDPVLLVLDNLEHVIDIAVDLAHLVATTSNLKLLSTSRSPLHIQGEREYAVPQLHIADIGTVSSPEKLIEHESIALFVDRVQSIDRTFQLNEENSGTVAEICSRLDGFPLAIELAAARSKVLPLGALLQRLDNQLSLLQHHSRDLPSRMQTIRATIAWSYDLLTPDEQMAFRQLSIFTGDFSLDAAERLLGRSESAAIDLLDSLIDKSLLISRPVDGFTPHYRILAAMREFGIAMLVNADEEHQTRLRHASLFAEIVESSYEGLFNRDQAVVLARMDRNRDDIRAAIAWSLDHGEYPAAIRIAAHLWQYWNVRGHLAEGRRTIKRILESSDSIPDHLLANLYYGASILSGNIAQVEESATMAEELLTIALKLNDRRMIATAHHLIGMTAWNDQDVNASLTARDLWRDLDEPLWNGMITGDLSRRVMEVGDLKQAELYAREAHETLRETGHLWGYGMVKRGLARIERFAGNPSRSLQLVKEGLALVSEIGDRVLVIGFLSEALNLASDHRDWERVIILSAVCERQRQRSGYLVRHPSDRERTAEVLAKARLATGAERFDQLTKTGESLSIEDAIQYALELELSDTKTTRSPGSPNSHGLTSRELDVLQRVVQGKTDQAIADELFVSYRTVTTHVTNILNKLGASTRTEATAIAIRQNLIDS